MPNSGLHTYYNFNKDGLKFKITLADCDYPESRRFINSLSDSNAEQLFETIYNNVWLPNRYGVQSKTYDTYLIGYSSTQDFINHTSNESTFWGIVPFHLVCLSCISFHPFNAGDCRWNIMFEFGSASEFKFSNHDPNTTNINMNRN